MYPIEASGIASRPFRAFIDQSMNTSGEVPSMSVLDKIVQSELGANAEKQYRARLLNYVRERQMLDLQDKQDIMDSRRKQGGFSALTGLATTGLTLMK